jgi:hypothetical protein
MSDATFYVVITGVELGFLTMMGLWLYTAIRDYRRAQRREE